VYYAMMNLIFHKLVPVHSFFEIKMYKEKIDQTFIKYSVQVDVGMGIIIALKPVM
jgi:hypothetical protein